MQDLASNNERFLRSRRTCQAMQALPILFSAYLRTEDGTEFLLPSQYLMLTPSSLRDIICAKPFDQVSLAIELNKFAAAPQEIVFAICDFFRSCNLNSALQESMTLGGKITGLLDILEHCEDNNFVDICGLVQRKVENMLMDSELSCKQIRKICGLVHLENAIVDYMVRLFMDVEETTETHSKAEAARAFAEYDDFDDILERHLSEAEYSRLETLLKKHAPLAYQPAHVESNETEEAELGIIKGRPLPFVGGVMYHNNLQPMVVLHLGGLAFNPSLSLLLPRRLQAAKPHEHHPFLLHTNRLSCNDELVS